MAFRATLLGKKYVLTDRTPGAWFLEYRSDGTKHVEISDAGSWKNVHVSNTNRPAYQGLLLEHWLPVTAPLSYRSSRLDPQFGNVLIYTGPKGSIYEFAKDRDWILLRRGGLFEVLSLAKVGNCWVPTELVRRGMSPTDPDVYSSISASPVTSSERLDLSLPMKPGYLWIDKNVYYDVVDGKLVRSKMQPENTKGWWRLPVTGGLLAFGLVLVICNWHRLFGKSNGPLGGERKA